MSNSTPPTTLDKLASSLNTRFRDVFISYGRAESKAFATKLCNQLTEKGYKVWFDQNDIPLGVDFQDQIDEGIETAHNFIFIIAPHAVKSPYCRKEIDLAIKRGKRIIPILQIEPTTKEVWDMMHPAIGKINWVYMRQKWEKEKEQTDYEAIDDFDTGFEGILSLLEQEKEYVQKHTEILFRAIEWERNHHNSMHLLVANERKQAEEWLFRRFDNTQPPCLPSDLHARFISEAKKNANNLQTDIFIASAEKESTESMMTKEQIIYRLSLHGYTSWTHINDLSSGVDFHEAIKKGVEGSDNLVFLITKESLQSAYCMEELEYAISLNKRIIPLRLEWIDEKEFPPSLKDIQYIDFADNVKEVADSKNDKSDFDKDIDELLRILETDNEYLQRHKILLTQALKWQRQDKNPSMLLRGHNLEQAKIWLKIGQKRHINFPLPIHEEFIKESQAKSSSERTDVFVSYSRTDGDIARRLNESLQITGKTTWFDQESIASGADFQKEIYQGIQNADNIIFILSPESILSPYCADEVEYAQKLGKRFITLLYREINTDELHGALSAVQWIDFRANTTKFETQFAEVLRTLDTDREHVQAHTKWQNEAMEWIDFDKNSDFLLRGNELLLANEWIEAAKENQKVPLVTDLQKEFIKESLKQQNKVNLAIERNKQLAIATIAIIFAVAVLAASQWYKSYQHQKELAIKNLVFESKDMVELYPDRALQLAYEAYNVDKKTSLLAVKNLYHLIEDAQMLPNQNSIFYELKCDDSIISVVAAKNKSRFITISSTKLSLFDEKGSFIKVLEEDKPNLYYNNIEQLKYLYGDFDTPSNYKRSVNDVHFVAISDDGDKIVTYSDDQKINLFDKEGNKIKEITGIKSGENAKVRFLELQDTTALAVLAGFLHGEHYPKSFTLFDLAGDTLSYHDTINEQNSENGLYAKIVEIWNKSNAQIHYQKTILKERITFNLGNHSVINEDGEVWLLTHNNNPDSILVNYALPKDVFFLTLDDDDFMVTCIYNTAYIFMLPTSIKGILDEIIPLSAEEKIEYQVASLDDYRQVPAEMTNIISKILLFLTVFLLSILVLNYMNMLFLTQKYFKIIIYIIVGFFIGLGWFIFIMNENHVVTVAFSSALSLSIAGIIFGIKDVNKKLYFNGSLYLFAAISLFIGSVFIFHYTHRIGGFIQTVTDLFGGVSLLIWVIVGIVGFATEKASEEFSQRNFTYFADWIGIVVATIFLFIVFSITKLSFENALSVLLVFLVFPFTYFFRTLIHQSVLYNFQKAPYSLSVLRSYIPSLILFPCLFIGLLIEWGGESEGSNDLLFISVLALFIYSFFLYLYTIFVAFKQKDKINLRANFFFWWTAIIFIVWLFSSPSSETTLGMFLSGLIWIAPLIWWAINIEKK